MTYPAWYTFYRDPVIRRNPSACCVYAALLGLDRIFYDPRPIKAWVIAEALELKPQTVMRALTLLIERGYVIEHGRSQNNVRIITIATTLPDELSRALERTAPPAA